jgi:(4S)-4-hydroxy-5-phosphonooxypentane-2,3-dione isomerase
MAYHVLVKFTVPQKKRNAFMIAGRTDAHDSLKNETGTLNFEIIEDEVDLSVIYFHEVYQSKEAFEVHCRGKAFETFFESISKYCSPPEFLCKGNRSIWIKPHIEGMTK